MIRIMASHDEWEKARQLLDRLIADLRLERPEAAIAELLRDVPRHDVLRARRLIDLHLSNERQPLPLVVASSGIPLRDWLIHVGLTSQQADRVIVFIDEYGDLADRLGRPPKITELASDTEQSVATINRRLAEYRSVFPNEPDPFRVARVLRGALDDVSLWGSYDGCLNARLRDVPVAETADARMVGGRR
jgi:hypothetical protein